MKIPYKLMDEKAEFYSMNGTGGLFYLGRTQVLKPGEELMVRTGVAFQIPKGVMGVVVPSSLVMHECGIEACVSLVMQEYRQEVSIRIKAKKRVDLVNGMEIGKILFVPYIHPLFEQRDTLR